jgi:hypothetical protein
MEICISLISLFLLLGKLKQESRNYTEATERGPSHGQWGWRGLLSRLLPFAYSCIPFQSPLAYVNQPLSLAEVITLLSLLISAWTEKLDDWRGLQGSTRKEEQ